MSDWKLVDALAKGSVTRSKVVSRPDKLPRGGVMVPINAIKDALNKKKKKKKKPYQDDE